MTITRIQAVDRGWGYKPEQMSLLVAADDSEAICTATKPHEYFPPLTIPAPSLR